jgi:hypothetical protein
MIPPDGVFGIKVIICCNKYSENLVEAGLLKMIDNINHSGGKIGFLRKTEESSRVI